MYIKTQTYIHILYLFSHLTIIYTWKSVFALIDAVLIQNQGFILIFLTMFVSQSSMTVTNLASCICNQPPNASPATPLGPWYHTPDFLLTLLRLWHQSQLPSCLVFSPPWSPDSRARPPFYVHTPSGLPPSLDILFIPLQLSFPMPGWPPDPGMPALGIGKKKRRIKSRAIFMFYTCQVKEW